MATAFLDRVSNKAIGQMLVERGTVTEEQLQDALAVSKREGVRVGEALVRLGYVSRETLGYVLGEQYGVRPMELHPDMIDERLVKRFPLDLLQQHQMLPLIEVGDELVVVLSDPNDTAGLRELSSLVPSYTISPQLADAGQLRRCLETFADLRPRVSGHTTPAFPTECRLEPVVPQSTDMSFADWLVATAVQHPDTDVLIRHLGAECQVALRRDGGLEELHRFPANSFNSVRDALLRNCVTAEHSNEQAAWWSAPLRFAGRTFDLLVLTTLQQRVAMVRLRALEHATGSLAEPTCELPVLTAGTCTVIMYHHAQQLESFVGQLFNASAGEQVILLMQEVLRRSYDGVYSFPAAVTNAKEAALWCGATCIVFDAPPAPREVTRLLQISPGGPAVVVCAAVADGEGTLPDVDELQQRVRCRIMRLDEKERASQSQLHGNGTETER